MDSAPQRVGVHLARGAAVGDGGNAARRAAARPAYLRRPVRQHRPGRAARLRSQGRLLRGPTFQAAGRIT